MKRPRLVGPRLAVVVCVVSVAVLDLGAVPARASTYGQITEFPVPTAPSGPQSITAGPDGNLWFTEGSGNRIGKVTPSGTFTEFGVPTASSNPTGIAAGPDGNPGRGRLRTPGRAGMREEP